MGAKKYVPWWGKIIAKIVLSRIPLAHQTWQRLGLFLDGEMAQPSYAYQVFQTHFNLVKPKEEFVGLELGPGSSLFSAVLAKVFGCSSTYLVDAGDFALRDLQIYLNLDQFLREQELPTIKARQFGSIEQILDYCSAQYLTKGLSSLKDIPDHSVDFIWSQAVLEHIRIAEFPETIRELRRIIKNDGLSSHVVDLRDHLGGSLNNLRFPKNIWESDFMASSGFYTNRIQYSEMLKLFKEASFDVEVVEVKRWDKLPTPKPYMSPQFREISEEELCISGFSAILKPV